jgi:hypothetical protein
VLGAGRRKSRSAASEKAPFAQENKHDPYQGAPMHAAFLADPASGTSTSSAAESPNMTSTSSGMPGALAAPIPLPTEPEKAVGGRNVLASMRDENQSGEHLILPNSVVTVLWP